jgi:hypothetical protein
MPGISRQFPCPDLFGHRSFKGGKNATGSDLPDYVFHLGAGVQTIAEMNGMPDREA